MLKIVESRDPAVQALLAKEYGNEEAIEARVRQVLADVRGEGDAAVFRYTRRFDGAVVTADNFRVTKGEIDEAYSVVEPDFLAALRAAKENIEQFHRRQVRNSWMEADAKGNIVGQLLRPLARVGIYVPGGTAAYPSSVLMNAVPARVAGVREVVMVTPPGRDGSINLHALVAAAEAGVDEIFKAGGAQAVAALAYGTQSVRRVDKVTGPGNIYVTMAKKLVYGVVDIDMLAGPSEVLVVADESAEPVYVAADLLSQAEHDVMASAILITPSRSLAERVRDEVARQLALLPRREIAAQALESYGAIVVTGDLEEALAMANRIAPEHLELVVADPWQWLGRVENAGAIFLGPHTPEPVGDYFAGPNHVLPTGGTARFYSPLGVDTFMKRSSVLAYSAEGMKSAGQDIITLAAVEGLDGHANAVRVRLEGEKR